MPRRADGIILAGTATLASCGKEVLLLFLLFRSETKLGLISKNGSTYFFGLIHFVPLQFSTFGDLPLQFNYLESCHYNSRIHCPRPFCTPRAPLDPLAGDRICVLPSLPLADAHTGPTRAPTPRRTHSRLSFPSRLAAPNPRSPTAGGEDDGGRRRPGSAEATTRIQERAARGAAPGVVEP